MTVDEMRVTEMDDASVRAFLATQKTGVLGLAAEDGPYLLPMSYGYDDDRTLYFTFVGGPDSRKRDLVESSDRARFLTYTAQSPFNWESVLLTGRLEALPDDEWAAVLPELPDVWRPDVVEAAMETSAVTGYRFTVESWTGYKHTGLPPGFDPDA